MSGLTACVSDLLSKGFITKEQAERLSAQEAADLARGIPEKDTIRLFKDAIQRDKQLAIRQAGILNKLTAQVRSHPKGLVAGLEAIPARDLYELSATSDVYSRKNAIEKTATGMMSKAIDAMAVKRLGFWQNHKLIEDVVRAMHGGKADPETQALAKQIADVFEWLRLRFNNAGGNIYKNPLWGLPHSHNGVAVKDMTFKGWRNLIEPLLDRKSMVNADGMAFTDEGWTEALEYAYQSIVTQGLNKLTPGQIVGRKLANQRQDARFLVFKDADSWMAYDAIAGSGNPFHAITHHIREMASDIALLEIMGPNPNHTYRVLRDSIAKELGDKDVFGKADSLWSVVAGAESTTGGMSIKWVERLREWRAAVTSIRLGSATISATSDTAFMAQTAAINGLDVVRTFQNYASQLDPTNAADRAIAAQLGLTMDAATYFAAAGNRFGDVSGTGIASKGADIAMRASIMTAHTQSAQRAIGLSWMMKVAEYRAKDFGNLPPAFRKVIDQVGLNESHWNILRTAPVEKTRSGVEAINMIPLANKFDEPTLSAVSKAYEAIEILTHFAVPMPDAHTKALAARWFGPTGSVGREVFGNSIMQFKTFGIGVAYSHLTKIMYTGSVGDKLSHAAALFISTTIMGAFALQMHEIARGRTPRPIWDRNFLGRAILQGGGAGIYGDAIYAMVFDINRFGGSPTDMVAGPLPGMIIEAAKATTGAFGGLVQGQEPEIGRDLVQLAGRNTPILSSLWYAKTAYDRMIINQLEMMVDRDSEIRWDQQDRKRRTEYGNEHWWKKGEVLPEPVKDVITF